MSAPSSIVFFGLRITLPPTDSTALEDRSHPRIAAARKVGLQTYWFYDSDSIPVLLIGKKLCQIGVEHLQTFSIEEGELFKETSELRVRLSAGGLEGAPGLHFVYLGNE